MERSERPKKKKRVLAAATKKEIASKQQSVLSFSPLPKPPPSSHSPAAASPTETMTNGSTSTTLPSETLAPHVVHLQEHATALKKLKELAKDAGVAAKRRKQQCCDFWLVSTGTRPLAPRRCSSSQDLRKLISQ